VKSEAGHVRGMSIPAGNGLIGDVSDLCRDTI